MNPTARTTLRGVLLHDDGVLLGLTHRGVWELPGIESTPSQLPASLLSTWLSQLVGATVRVGIMLDAGETTPGSSHIAYRCHLAQLWAQQVTREVLNWELPCPDDYRLLMFVEHSELDHLVVTPSHVAVIRLAIMVENSALAA